MRKNPNYRTDPDHSQLPLFEEPGTHTAYPEATEAVIQQKAVWIPIYRISLVRESAMPYHTVPQMRSSKDVSNLLHEYLKGTDREHFVAILVDQKNRAIGLHTVSMGSLTASVVHPREALKPIIADDDFVRASYTRAIRHNAANLIFGHNHPSGDPQPSREDRALTTRLVQAGKLLGILVLDHVIIGNNTYFSFADEGLLDANAT